MDWCSAMPTAPHFGWLEEKRTIASPADASQPWETSAPQKLNVESFLEAEPGVGCPVTISNDISSMLPLQ